MRTTGEKLRQMDASEKKNSENVEAFVKNAQDDGWISIKDRLPTLDDADEQECVLAWHRYQKAIVLNVHNVVNYGSYITHWRKLPAPPEG